MGWGKSEKRGNIMQANPENLLEFLRRELAKRLTPREIMRLSEDEMRVLTAQVYSEMELRVGKRLSAPLADAEIEEFENILNDPEKGEVDSAIWVAKHCPNYPQIVMETMAEVVEETGQAVAAVLHAEVVAARVGVTHPPIRPDS